MKSWYLGNTLILSNDGTFRYDIIHDDNTSSTVLNGTFKISSKGILSFPTTVQTYTYNGKSTSMECVSQGHNSCMLTLNIKKYSATELIVTISGVAKTEITKDMSFRYILK